MPRCLFGHGWLPMLSGVNGDSLWAAEASKIAVHLVEVALGLSQRIVGVVVGGVVLIVFGLRVSFSLVDAFVLFLDLFSQYRGLRWWGVILALEQLMLCTLVLTVWEWFVMLGACWMVAVVLLLLSLSLMVIFFCFLRGCFIVGVRHGSDHQGQRSCCVQSATCLGLGALFDSGYMVCVSSKVAFGRIFNVIG